MLLDSQPRSFDTFVGVLSDASSTTVAQLLLDARQAIGSDVGAALRCIEQAASLLEAPLLDCGNDMSNTASRKRAIALAPSPPATMSI